MDTLNWDELIRGKHFISDLGSEKLHIVGRNSVKLGRYAAWTWNVQAAKTSHQLAEVSDNLEYLVRKYNIERDLILVLESVVHSSKSPPKHLRRV